MDISAIFKDKGLETNTVSSAPCMGETYTSATGRFRRLEDVDQVKSISGVTKNKWIEYTSTIVWPGPIYELNRVSSEIPIREGIRGIPINKIIVDFPTAFELAINQLIRSNRGDEFIGTIELYWPLTTPRIYHEPNYVFNAHRNTIILIGAFTGSIHVCHSM